MATQERQPRSEKRQRNEVIVVRMSAAERAQAQQIADAIAKGSLSALLRESALSRSAEAQQLFPVSA